MDNFVRKFCIQNWLIVDFKSFFKKNPARSGFLSDWCRNIFKILFDILWTAFLICLITLTRKNIYWMMIIFGYRLHKMLLSLTSKLTILALFEALPFRGMRNCIMLKNYLGDHLNCQIHFCNFCNFLSDNMRKVLPICRAK